MGKGENVGLDIKQRTFWKHLLGEMRYFQVILHVVISRQSCTVNDLTRAINKPRGKVYYSVWYEAPP